MGKIIVAATTNRHKIEEISATLSPFGYTVISRAEAGVPDLEITEDGSTFEENSLIKARAVFDLLGGGACALADDSGIEVDALNGAPGVYSARFAGQQAPGAYMAGPDGDEGDFTAAKFMAEQGSRSLQDMANNVKLLRLLEGMQAERRAAKFVSVVTCLRPGKAPVVCRGEVSGRIGFAPTGTAGFGYDPLFIPLGYDHSFSVFTPEDKNAISHRGRALLLLAEKLKDDMT